MTATTIPILLLTSILMVVHPRYMLIALLAMFAWQDAAFLKLGSSPIYVGWAFALFVTARCCLLLYPFPRYELTEALISVAPLIAVFLFGILATAASFVMFYNGFLTMPGSAKFILTSAQLYQPVSEQFNQNVYMLVTLVCIVVITCYLGRLSCEELVRLCNQMFYCAAVFAITVALWHFLNLKFGVPFPGALFHSSGTSNAWQQELMGVSRISGSFSEPSAVTGYFCLLIFYLGTQSALTGNMVASVLTALCALVMLLSTSTTSYIFVPLFAAYFLFLTAFGTVAGGEISRVRSMVLLAAAILTISAGVNYIFDNYDYYKYLIEYSFNKRYSTSYAMRSASNDLALEIFLKTGGVGVGLGAHRASGLAYNILTSFGIAGILGFGAYVLVHLLHAWRVARGAPELRGALGGLGVAAAMSLGAASTSAGEVTAFIYYLPFALLSGFWIAFRREQSLLVEWEEDQASVEACATVSGSGLRKSVRRA